MNSRDRYGAYKETGAEWCRSVPEHWKFLPVRRVGTVTNGGTPPADAAYWNGDIPFVTPPDLRLAEADVIAETERTLTTAGVVAGSSTVPAGSVIASIRAPIGYVGRTSVESSFNQGCRALTPGPTSDARYTAYSLVAARQEMDAQGRGTTFMEVSASQFAAIPLPLPPLTEQRAIADFLDEQTSRIDTLIDKQTQLITTLRERRERVREALAVHVGAGDRLKWRLVEIDQRAGSNAERLPLMSVSIDWGVRRRDEITSDDHRADDLSVYKVCTQGDIVVNRMRAFQGALGVAPEDGLVSPDYAVLRARSSAMDCDWMVEVMRTRAFIGEMVLRIRGIGGTESGAVRTPRINVADLLDIRVAPTPTDVQASDLRSVRAQTTRLDALIAKAKAHIGLAEERRSALITAAVTGQIDVRTAGRATQGVA